MEIPLWLNKAIQARLDEVSAHIEHHTDIQPIRAKESRAFYAMFEGREIVKSPAFKIWEDQHHLKHSLINEQLYKQGVKDGIQLVSSLLRYADLKPLLDMGGKKKPDVDLSEDNC